MSVRQFKKKPRKSGRGGRNGAFSRGQIYFVNMTEAVGSEQTGNRPAVIVSNNTGNLFSTIVEVVFLTTKKKPDLPTHVLIDSAKSQSVALCEQIQTVDKKRLSQYIGTVSRQEMGMIDQALAVSLSLPGERESKNRGNSRKKKLPVDGAETPAQEADEGKEQLENCTETEHGISA